MIHGQREIRGIIYIVYICFVSFFQVRHISNLGVSILIVTFSFKNNNWRAKGINETHCYTEMGEK